MSSVNKAYNYTDKPIQLIKSNNDFIEITSEGYKFLSSIKNQKLSILSVNGPSKTGKTSLSNNLISKTDKNGFDSNKSTEGIWIWGNPINLKENNKLLILDSQGNDNKILLISLLISTHFIYNTNGDISNEVLSKLITDLDAVEKISLSFNYGNDLSNYLPKLIVTNDKLSKNEIQSKIENDQNNKKLFNLYKNIISLESKNCNNLINEIKTENLFKVINNKYIDGLELFGLLQNYIDFLNVNNKPDISIAFENILLFEAKNISDSTFEKYKDELYKKIECPNSIINIYKNYLEIQNKYIEEFCANINKNISPNNISEYIISLNNNMEKEINSIINNNYNFYQNYFLSQFTEFKKNCEKSDNFNNINDLTKFCTEYVGILENSFKTFFNVFEKSENSNKFFVDILMKIYQEFFCNKLIKIRESINKLFEEYKSKTDNEINSLKLNVDKYTNELTNNKKLNEEKDNEKNKINKNFLELESKFNKFNREYQIKIKESENNINVETQRYKKMESYYLDQLKEKDQMINTLQSKNEKLIEDSQANNKENIIKINELNRENNILLSEIERFKDMKLKGGDDKNFNANLQSIFKNLQTNFVQLKESIDNINKEEENVKKNKYLESAKQEIDNKLNTCVNDIKNFCDIQIKNVSDNYEKLIKKIKNDCEELTFELSKKNFAIEEQKQLAETYEKKYNESNNNMNKLNDIVKSKEKLIETQKDGFQTYQNQINDYKKIKEDLEMNLAKNIYNFKMKEEEFDFMFMVIEGIVSKKKDKFEQNVTKLSPDVQRDLRALIKNYKYFK